MPWPPPTHIVSRPIVLSCARRPLISVVVIRAPVMPNGWPSAMAPRDVQPCRRTGRCPASRAEGRTCAANASLISTRSTSAMLIPARASACRLASTGPRPMISGDRPDTPVATTRASGVMPSAVGPGVGHDDQRGRAVVERAAVARGDPAVRAEHRFELADRLVAHPRPWPVVGADLGAVGQGDRGDLAGEEPVGDGLLGQVLRAHAEPVHVLAGDALEQGEVLRGLAHRDVDVRQVLVLAGIVPVGRALLGDVRGAVAGVGEDRVAGVGQRVGAALREPGHRLHPGRDEHVALAGPDRVQGHPGGLQRGGAVPGDGGAGQPVVAEQHRDHPGHVEPLLAAGQPAAEHQIVDLGRIELWHLGQRGPHQLHGQVIGPDRGERPLERATDRGSGGGDDHGFGHRRLLPCAAPERTRRGGRVGISRLSVVCAMLSP